MIPLIALSLLFSAPPKHIVDGFGSAVKARNCALVLFYAGRLKRYQPSLSPAETTSVEACQKTLFPRKINWFKSVHGELRFVYPEGYITTPPRLAAIPAGYWWLGWVPSLKPLAARLKSAAGLKDADPPAGRWQNMPAFRIMVREVTTAELSAGKLGGVGKPAARVSFTRARAFCRKIGGDLPTEEQWEVAARGGEYFVVFSWGEAIPSACYRRTGPACGRGKAIHDVSQWGVRDLSSSLAEWVLPAKGLAVAKGFAITKGGGNDAHWYHNLIPSRAIVSAPTKSKSIGFRCVLPALKP